MTMRPPRTPAVRPRPAWAVRVSPAELRVLQACVACLLDVERDPAMRRRLASARRRLAGARPVEVGHSGHSP
jgi:hypothetical protein